MMRRGHILLLIITAMLQSCMQWEPSDVETVELPHHGLFITSEGNFQYGNASLSFYDPATMTVTNEVFRRANGFKLGDVAQSVTVHRGRAWIVVNNSHVVFAVNTTTCRETGRIVGLTSPRYMHFVSDDKAYITQLWDNRICIVDPRSYTVTGHITVPGMTAESGSTEQMVQKGRYVYVSCWSYQNSILRIDTTTDAITDKLEVGIQPKSMALDCHGKLWVATDGGYEGSPYGHEPPSLVRIDADTFTIEQVWTFDIDQSPRELQTNASGDTLYWIADDVWRMSVDAQLPPTTPFIPGRGTIYYGLTVSPDNGDVYVADAIDYQQPGKIYRYNSQGNLIDQFYAGVIPGAFAWKQ